MNSVASRPLPDRRTALLGAGLFHALLLGVFFVAVVPLPHATGLDSAGVVLDYGVDEAGAGSARTTAPVSRLEASEGSGSGTGQASAAAASAPAPVATEPLSGMTAVGAAAGDGLEARATLTSEAEPTIGVAAAAVAQPGATYTPGAGRTGAGAEGGAGSNEVRHEGVTGSEGVGDESTASMGKYLPVGKALDMAGWTWETNPQVRDASSEEGKLVFEISVDGQGEVLRIVKVSSTVGPEVERAYRNALENTSFIRTTAGTHERGATGRVTFVLRAR